MHAPVHDRRIPRAAARPRPPGGHEWALWRLEAGAGALGPRWPRDRLRERAAALTDRYRAPA